jgi:hypothetical protein
LGLASLPEKREIADPASPQEERDCWARASPSREIVGSSRIPGRELLDPGSRSRKQFRGEKAPLPELPRKVYRSSSSFQQAASSPGAPSRRCS